MQDRTLIDDAVEALSRHRALPEIEPLVPSQPGLYAVNGSASVWRALGLDEPGGPRPLYVGKAERSLAARDIRTHFLDGRTGSSTLRRSLAALLREELGLRALPRNPENLGTVASFALSPKDDRELTRWMRSNLRLAAWAPADTTTLREVERAVLKRLDPPLNLQGVSATPERKKLRAARAAMFAEAKAWAKGHPSLPQ